MSQPVTRGNCIEIQLLLQGVVSRSSCSQLISPGYPEVIEDGDTLRENAIKKAMAGAAALREKPVIADDSGLVVDALGGLPGVRSARFAGEDAGDAENNAKLLRELVGDTLRSSGRQPLSV